MSIVIKFLHFLQAIEYYKQSKESDNSQSNPCQHPIFEITLNRKFEISELSEIFVGKWLKYVYLVLVVVYGFSVAGPFQLWQDQLGPLTFPTPLVPWRYVKAMHFSIELYHLIMAVCIHTISVYFFSGL